MGIKIYNNHIFGADIGISVPENANVEIDANAIVDCRTAIEIRDEVSLRANLGLSKEANVEEISRLFQSLSKFPTIEAAAEFAKINRAENLLSAGANLTTLISGFFQLKESGLVKSAIAILSGQA